MKLIRWYKFRDMCKKCKYKNCRHNCKLCGCRGHDKAHDLPYCKCGSLSTENEKRCYYYRKVR